MKMYNKKSAVALFLFLLFFTPSFVSAQDQTDMDLVIDSDLQFEDERSIESKSAQVQDPWEKLNRKSFKLNDVLINHVFSPLSKGYDFLIPQKAQKSIYNLFSNARSPSRFFNCLFQKKYKGSSIELRRFLINSTIGIGGLFDPADYFWKLKIQEEDFSQTLGVWGMDEGNYLVVPVLGPSTTRDVLGYVGDLAFSPFFWIGIYDVEPEDVFQAASIVKRVNNYTYYVEDKYKSVTEDAVDPYAALQHAYIQIRREKTAK